MEINFCGNQKYATSSEYTSEQVLNHKNTTECLEAVHVSKTTKDRMNALFNSKHTGICLLN